MLKKVLVRGCFKDLSKKKPVWFCIVHPEQRRRRKSMN